MQKLFLANLVLATAVSSLAAQSPLTTLYANNNSGAVNGAIYFDLNPAVGLSITGIDVNLNTAASTPGSIDIYQTTTATTHVGNEANMAAWTMVGTGTVTSNGAGTPSTITLAAPIPMAPGPVGFAYVGVGHSFAYTNGNGTNQNYSTAELSLSAGSATNVAFSGTPFTPRVVNTTISYAASGGNFALKTPYGDGCYDSPRMVYEQFDHGPGPYDLVNTNQAFIYNPSPTGGNYIIINGAAPAYDAATAAANGVALQTLSPTSSSSAGSWDDASIVMTLPAAFGAGFPFPGAGSPSTLDITINSNGRIYLGNTTDTSFATNGANSGFTLNSFQGIVGSALPALAGFNCDLDPTAGGNIWYEDPSPNGGVRVTWDNVPNWQNAAYTPAAGPNDIQIELLPGGFINYAFGPNLANGGSTGNFAITGFSAGGGEPLSDPVDWSMLAAYVTGDGSIPLVLDGDARPVIGTTVQMTIDNIPPATPIAAYIYGLAQFNPGVSLTSIGMDGCFQYTDFGSVKLVIGPGSSVTDPFVIPNDPGLSGVIINAQAAAYNPGVINNVLGATSSNGVELLLDLN